MLVGCVGFAILFNVHGGGMWLCTLGGVATWMVYLLAQQLGYGVYSMNFFATLVAALYAETMARIRKYPVTSYLVVSTFPPLPGAGIYYTMSLGLAGRLPCGAGQGLETAGIAGCLAVGDPAGVHPVPPAGGVETSARQELSAKPPYTRNKDCGHCPQSLFD